MKIIKEKVITPHDFIEMNRALAEYCGERLENNEASALCGFPESERREVVQDFSTGNLIIRFFT